MLADLEWLPPPPKDFRARVQALRSEIAGGSQANFHERLMGLAATALDDAQLTRLGALAGDLAEAGTRIDGLTAAKLGLLGDGTLSLAIAPIVGSGLRHGLRLDIVEG